MEDYAGRLHELTEVLNLATLKSVGPQVTLSSFIRQNVGDGAAAVASPEREGGYECHESILDGSKFAHFEHNPWLARAVLARPIMEAHENMRTRIGTVRLLSTSPLLCAISLCIPYS